MEVDFGESWVDIAGVPCKVKHLVATLPFSNAYCAKGAQPPSDVSMPPTPEPADPVIGLGVDQINRRFADACAAAGLEGRRTSHGGLVGHAVKLTARGASTHAIQFAGGWKTPSMVVRYAATCAERSRAGRRPGSRTSRRRRAAAGRRDKRHRQHRGI